MNKLNIFDQMKILWEVSKSSYWFFIIFLLFLFLIVLFFTEKRRSKQVNFKIYLIFSLAFILLIFLSFSSSLNQAFDYLMNHLFIAVLFPNFAIYFVGVVITNIIFWVSFFHSKTSDVIRKTNIIVYFLLSYLLILILSIVNINQLDVFSESNIYIDEKATALIELSTFVFIFWIVFLCLYKIILTYLKRKEEVFVEDVVFETKKLPSNYQPITLPSVLFGNPGKRITMVETNPYRFMEDYEKKLTLEDYQLLLKILKEAKAKKRLHLQEDLTKEKIRKMKIEEELREKEKYTELDLLYRSIR